MDKIIIFLKILWLFAGYLILLPFAIIFMLLSIINYKFFWEKWWCKLIDFIFDNGLLPEKMV